MLEIVAKFQSKGIYDILVEDEEQTVYIIMD